VSAPRQTLGGLGWIAGLGRRALAVIGGLGAATHFLLRLLWVLPQALRRPGQVVLQLFRAGVLSLPIIVVSAVFVGMVLALQGYHTLAQFNAEESLGVVVALALVRELGPVVAALLFAGRAGSALTAEIGLMKSTEQLAALELMAIDPYTRVLAPRLLGVVLALPLLTVLFDALGILGGYWVGVGSMGVDSGSYWGQMRAQVLWGEDIVGGLWKSVAFAVVIGWIALRQGEQAEPTAAGVAHATTLTVVWASIAILALDFVLTALMM